MATQTDIDKIMETYKCELHKNHWSNHHLETIHIVVGELRPNGCPVFHQSRRQMDPERYIIMKSQRSLDLFAMQKRKERVTIILIEGAPGVCKTTVTLCHFFIEERMSGKAFQQFEMVPFFPICLIKSHTETSNFELLNEALTQILSEMSVCTSLLHYLIENDGKGVLIIVDGWNELDENERQSGTLPHELLFGSLLNHVSVMVTSRPFATESLGVPCEAIDKFVRIHGFSEEIINKYILSEITDTPEKGHCLLKELENNPTLKCMYMCSVPIDVQVVCHLQCVSSTEVCVTTLTELYSKHILALLCDDNQEYQYILTFDSIPFNMQKSWWDLCNLAFSMIKNSLFVFSQEKVANCFHRGNDALLRFKLLHSVEYGTTKTMYYQFLHVTFQEFLAALYISNKMTALEQNEVYKSYGQSSHFGLVWRFFLGLNLQKSIDAIKSSILSAKIPTLDLCQLAFETKDTEFSFQLTKKSCKCPMFITPTAYDYAIVYHVIKRSIQDYSDISLDTSNCILGGTNLGMLADVLADRHKMKNLVLSGNKITDDDIAYLFSKVSCGLQHIIENLNLHDNQIGNKGVRSITKALAKLRSLQLSNNSLGISGIHALESAIMSGILSDMQEIKLQRVLTEDRNTNDELLDKFLKIVSDYCNELQSLDISESCISKKCAKAVAMCLSSKPLRLHVNETTLGNEGLEALFNACKGVCNVESLEMKSNYISSKGIQCFVEKVSSGTLLKGGIHLDENPLGMEAVLIISQLLSNTHCLISSLSLVNCQLSENIGHDTSITANHIYQHFLLMSQNSGLSQLELDCNNFSEDGLQILSGFAHLCPYLKFLSSRCCQLTSVDLNTLLTKLSEERVYDKLATWCLANCNIDNDGVSKYVSGPVIFPDIHLNGNPANADVKSKLKEVLDDMKTKEEEDVLHDQVETDGNQPNNQSTQLQDQVSLSAVKEETPIASELSMPMASKLCMSSVVQKQQQILLTCPSVFPLEKKITSPLKVGTYQTTLVDDIKLVSVLKSQTIIVEGKIGSGKSTLVQQLLHSERLHDFHTIVYCQLDYDACKQVQMWEDLSMILDTSESQLCEIEDMESEVLFIFDEFDDFVKKNEWKTTMFADILFRKRFINSSILMVSRPSGLSSLEESNYLKVDHHFQIKGFLNSPALKFQDHWIITMCEQHNILDMCEIPLLNELINKFFGQGNSNDTVTDLLMFVITEILKRENGDSRYSDLKLLNLPNGIKNNFENLCKLAFESYVYSHKFSSFEETNRFLSAFSLNNSFSLNDCENFGLIERVLTDLSDLNSCSIEFLHPMIGDFLAGFYLHLQPPLDQLELIHQHASLLLCQSHYIMQFFFGLTWRKDSELDLNPSKLMVNTLIEFLLCCLNQELQDSDCGLLLALCITETKDSELWKMLVTKFGSDFKFKLSSDDISKHKWTIASMISYSQVQEWNIHASNFSLCDELEPYVGARLNKFEVPSMERSVIVLSPKMTIEITAKRQRDTERFTQPTQMMNKFQCQAIREILQRAFAMYAKRMRLKGDSSNPAYVSFLSCECFQKNLEKNLKFDPPLPSHFLPVNSAKTLRKLHEEHGVHLASHRGKAIELVILLKPYLRRVTLTYNSKVHHIIMMSEALVQKTVNEGAIEQSCMTGAGLMDIMENENLLVCTEEAPTTSEMVRPSLPLPPNSISEQNLKTVTILPQVTVAGASPTPHSVLEENIKHDKQQRLHESQRAQAGAMIYNASSGSGSPQTFHLQFTSRQQQQITTVTMSQPTQGTRSSIKPGAVLFTSLPEQIPSDHIHPLPDETNQIRRGGNGQIFRGTIGGMSVVYKKTNYRSREFSIIIKLKHKNIIKLLAFMYGEENPAHKRRHFCYHVMPQMSGDCARMLTDKRELTIMELHKKHGDNIRKMGIVRGNLKYLLKEILHGLRYLHSLRITHRDIKGSNILLKFFCSCTNPLECGCESKYQAQICDFDAAIELDENERLPPTQVGTRISARSPCNHYISVPVGTNGFRSPECSMLAISNVTDVFYPPITTRSDIWSLGILTLRILIGATGPSSQREMALLLLHYYRQRYMHEGLHRRPECFDVDRLVTDGLLSMPNLVREVGWLKGAVRFIECCVAVDPFARYSADALLQHDFLY